MRGLSLWQPWAQLVASGAKRVETRSSGTRYRGPLLIHAAKVFPDEAREFAEFERALGRIPAQLPFGAAIATARLVDIRPTHELAPALSGLERLYGDYRPGRYAWVLEDVQALPEPIPCRGSQGLWIVPPDVARRLP